MSEHQAPVAALRLEDGLERWDVSTLVCDEHIASCRDPIEKSGEDSRPFRGLEHVQGSIDQEHVMQPFRFEYSNVADVALDIQALGLSIREHVTNSRGRLINSNHRMAQSGNE